MADYAQKAYPTASYIKFKEDSDIFAAVNDGVCALAFTTMNIFQEYSRKKETNGDCRLHWTGSLIKPSTGGLAVKADAGRKCTSLIHDVMNLHMLEMQADGFLEKAWEEHYARHQDAFVFLVNRHKV